MKKYVNPIINLVEIDYSLDVLGVSTGMDWTPDDLPELITD